MFNPPARKLAAANAAPTSFQFKRLLRPITMSTKPIPIPAALGGASAFLTAATMFMAAMAGFLIWRRHISGVFQAIRPMIMASEPIFTGQTCQTIKFYLITPKPTAAHWAILKTLYMIRFVPLGLGWFAPANPPAVLGSVLKYHFLVLVYYQCHFPSDRW